MTKNSKILWILKNFWFFDGWRFLSQQHLRSEISTGCNTYILRVGTQLQRGSERTTAVVHGRDAWRPRPPVSTLRRSVSRSTAPTGFARHQRRSGWYANAKQPADTDEFSHASTTSIFVRFVYRAPRRRSGVFIGINRLWSYPRQEDWRQGVRYTPGRGGRSG